jgi:hypothetical protein
VSSQHLVKDAAQRKDVGAMIAALAAYLFGRHVADRAQHDAGLCDRRHRRCLRAWQRLARLACETEVQDLDGAVGGDENVLRFQIPVRDVLVVRRGKSARDLRRDVDRFSQRQRTRRQARAERLALQQFHDGVGHTVAGAELVERDDVRVREHRDGARFALEPREGSRVGRDGRRNDLDGDVPSDAAVVRAIDLAHASGAEEAFNLIGTELCA